MRILNDSKLSQSMNHISILLGGLLLMFPFGFIPFSNTLPALGILCCCIGIMEKDGFIVFLGYMFNILSIVYFAILVSGGGYFIYEILRYLGFN